MSKDETKGRHGLSGRNSIEEQHAMSQSEPKKRETTRRVPA